MKKCIADLNAAHKEKYTPTQYRIWAEMKSGGLHDSMTTPPATSMFEHAGGMTPKKPASSNDPMSHAINFVSSHQPLLQTHHLPLPLLAGLETVQLK